MRVAQVLLSRVLPFQVLASQVLLTHVLRGVGVLVMAVAVPIAIAPPVHADEVALTDERGRELHTNEWGEYGSARVETNLRLMVEGHSNGSLDDYEVELDGRRALANAWRAKRAAASTVPDEYLDALLQVESAGFLEEYVLENFAKPGWTVPATALASVDLPAYRSWQRKHVMPPSPRVPIGVSSQALAGRPTLPRAPGAGLPDPESFLPSTRPCAESLPGLREAMDAWRREEKALRGAPTSMPESVDEFAQIMAHPVQKARAVQKARGLTLVDPRVGVLAFQTGFCLVDQQDYAGAAPWLLMAVDIAPTLSVVKMELAQVYLMQKKFDAVDALVDSVLTWETDACAIAIAWRKRGYVRFDQGRLAESRAAYLRSMDYDPDNEIARSELMLLDQQARETGNAPSDFQPLPPGPQVTTKCTAPQPRSALRSDPNKPAQRNALQSEPNLDRLVQGTLGRTPLLRWLQPS